MKSIKHTVYRNNQVTSYGLGSFSQGSDKFLGPRLRVRQILGRVFSRGSDKFSGGSSAKGQTNSWGLGQILGLKKPRQIIRNIL